MRRQFLVVGGIEVARGDNYVGVDVVSEFMYSAFCVHVSSSYNPNSSGTEILPVTALAAATAGLARYTSEST